jgi:ATP-binding cassette subfamily B protein
VGQSLAHLWRPYAPGAPTWRLQLVAGVLCLFLVSALQQSIPWMLKIAVDRLRAGHETVVGLAAAMAGAAALQAVIRIASRLLLFDIARQGEYDLRNRVFGHLLTLPPSYYRRVMTGDIMSRLTTDVQTMRIVWGPGLLNLANTIFQYGVALLLMLRLSPTLTLWALTPYPLLAFMTMRFARRLGVLSRKAQEQMGRLSAAAQEDLAGVGVLKAYALEDARSAEFGRRSYEYLGVNVQLAVTRGQMMPLMGAFGAIGTVLVLWRGGTMVASGELSLGALIAFNAYVALLLWPTLALGWIASLFQRGAASYQRVREILAVTPSIVDGPEPAPAAPVVGELRLAGLTVAAGARTLLSDVSLTIPAGSTCALVGRTGAGKTTLVEALVRLVEIEPGQVFLDGHDLTRMPLGWTRAAIGYAPQEAFLFSASIADNIGFGRRPPAGESAEARRAAIQRAAEVAGLARDLAALPAGLDTIVGERGITLSGGQRQRVALARAIAANPRLLILDDSLSSVDAHTEREILDRLAREREGRTVIVISHRTAVTADADLVAVLEEGRLAESGRHDALIAAGGLYARIYRERSNEEQEAA